MKKVILLLLFFPYLSFGQIADDFEAGSAFRLDSGSAMDTGMQILPEAYTEIIPCITYLTIRATGSDCIGLPLTDLHPSEGDYTMDIHDKTRI